MASNNRFKLSCYLKIIITSILVIKTITDLTIAAENRKVLKTSFVSWYFIFDKNTVLLLKCSL